MKEMTEQNEVNSIITMHCGAVYESKQAPEDVRAHFGEISEENGRSRSDMRIVTYDTEGGITRPKRAGKKMECRWECPCKRMAKRKEERVWPSIDDGNIPLRTIVSCKIFQIDYAGREEGIQC